MLRQGFLWQDPLRDGAEKFLRLSCCRQAAIRRHLVNDFRNRNRQATDQFGARQAGLRDQLVQRFVPNRMSDIHVLNVCIRAG